MRKHRRYPVWISNLLLIGLLLSSCSAPKESKTAASSNDNVIEPVFFSALSEFQDDYGFNAYNTLDLSGNDAFQAGENGFVWQGTDDEISLLPDMSIQPGDGFAIEFSFTESMSQWAFILESTGEENLVLRLGPDGISVQLGDQAQISADYDSAPDWQAGTHYVAFLHLNAAGGLDLYVWPVDQPGEIASVSLAQVSDTTYTLGIEAGSDQALTISSIWKFSGMAQTQTQAAAQPQEQAEDKEFSAEFQSALTGYSIAKVDSVQELRCGDQQLDDEDMFTWGANTNTFCDLNLQIGQALAFNFELAQQAQDWPNMAYLMLNANMDNDEMPTKKLGVALANDKVEVKQDDETFESVPYLDGFELQAGTPYSALVLMNEWAEFEIRIWPVGQPQQAMTALLGEANVPSTWRPVGNEQWVMGMWLGTNQQVSISHLYHVTLSMGQASTEVETSTQPASDEPFDENSWMATGEIPNLGEFYISELVAYDGLTCEDTQFAANAIDLPAQSEQNTSECLIDLPNDGQGWIAEFTFQGENASEDVPHLVDFAFINREDNRQRLLRYTPHFNHVSIKVDDEYLDDLTLDGELEWVAGKRYTLVFISQYAKFFYVWPSDDPSNTAKLIIPGDQLRESFGDLQPDALWQLRIWHGAGVNLKLDNMYHFSAQ